MWSHWFANDQAHTKRCNHVSYAIIFEESLVQYLFKDFLSLSNFSTEQPKHNEANVLFIQFTLHSLPSDLVS